MTKSNISKSDFALLPPLFALLKYKNVSHAAGQLHLSQSAMSKILAQLRASFDDELLVRTGKQYGLTRRGEFLLAELETLMPQAEKLWQAPKLDLANETRFISIAGTDMDIDFISPRLDSILQQAPNAGISITTSSEQSLQLLKAGELDFVMTAFDTSQEYLDRALLLSSDYVVVTNKSHSTATMDIASYLSLTHIAFQLSGARKSAVDLLLAQNNLRRKIALWTPTFYHALKTIATSSRDFALTMPQVFANRSQYAEQLNCYPLPVGLKPIKVYLYWHRKIEGDAFLRWVRGEILGGGDFAGVE